MKKGIIILVMSCLVASASGCVNYQAVVDDINGIGDEGTSKLAKVSIGDANKDGKEETVMVDGENVKLLTGTKILYEIKSENGIKYDIVSAVVSDIDNDNNNEIIIFASKQPEKDAVKTSELYVVDNSDGEYFTRKFPTELNNIGGKTGIDAQILPREDYIYEVTCKDNVFNVDASRVYGVSMMTVENKEKLKEIWDDILANNVSGDVLGITNAEVVTKNDGTKFLRVYELVKGADKYYIGNIVFNIEFNTDGSYEIFDIYFVERSDVQP